MVSHHSLTRAQRALLVNFEALRFVGPQTDKGVRRMYDPAVATVQAGVRRQSDSGLRTRRRELQDLGLVKAVGYRIVRGRRNQTFAITQEGLEISKNVY